MAASKSKPSIDGIKPKISKPRQQNFPRTDLEVKFLNIIYTRVFNIVKFDLAPTLKYYSCGRIWLHFVYAELKNVVPSLTLRMNDPFGVSCGAPYSVRVVGDVDADVVTHCQTRIEALLQYIYTYFLTFPLQRRQSLLLSKPVQLAQKRIENLRHLCRHLTHC